MTPETASPAILIVEHDAGVRTLLGRLVSQWGFTPLLAESEDRGIRLLRERSGVAVVLSDFQPGPDGETVYEHLIHDTSARVPPVVCTLSSARAVPDEVELLTRPFDVSLLRRTITQYAHGRSDSGHSEADTAGADATGADSTGADPTRTDSGRASGGEGHDAGAPPPIG